MVDLMGTLGLDKVEDPDNLPDNKYRGIIKQCGYVKSKTDKLGIVVIYKVNDPQSKYHGREKYDWTTIGEGNVHFDEEKQDWVFDKGAMSEAQKPYFNKRMEALGIPKSRLNNIKDEHLKSRVGLNVIFGIKNSGDYNNVNFVEVVGDMATIDPGSIGSSGVDPFTENPTPSPSSTPGGTNLADDI